MRYCHEHELFFMHVPKAAGTAFWTSYEDSLRSLEWDERLILPSLRRAEGDPWYYSHHPEIGPLHLGHLPLATIRDHFPRLFDSMTHGRSFAIVRDPAKRFLSSIQQRLREFGRVSIARIDGELLIKESRYFIDWLSGRSTFSDREYIHLAPQCDFIELSGQQFVDHVFAIENMANVKAWLETEYGIRPKTQLRSNESLVAPPWMQSLPPSLIETYRKMVPADAKALIYRYLARAKLLKPATTITTDLTLPTDVLQFLREFYARDFEIHSNARLAPLGLTRNPALIANNR